MLFILPPRRLPACVPACQSLSGTYPWAGSENLSLGSSARQRRDEALEAAHVGDRGAMAGKDQRRLEGGQLADRAAVLGRVIGEDLRWLLDAGHGGRIAHV